MTSASVVFSDDSTEVPAVVFSVTTVLTSVFSASSGGFLLPFDSLCSIGIAIFLLNNLRYQF